MKVLNKEEMRVISAGKTATCKCGRKFYDQKFLWWTIKTGGEQLKAHKKFCWACM